MWLVKRISPFLLEKWLVSVEINDATKPDDYGREMRIDNNRINDYYRK